MTSVLLRLRLIVMAAGMSVSPAGELCAETPGDETLVIRLVHPERQAAEVLSLFAGSRAPHPAAALAAWKRTTRDPGQLGKPLEAVIALFNPEMAREWGVLHEAELRLDLSAAGGKPRWYAVVPRDDGTVAAAVTAQRLTDGGQEPPLGEEGSGSGVERLGPPGSTVATQIGDALILGSSRDELMRALRRIRGEAGALRPTGPARAGESVIAGALDRLDSGLLFVLDPGRLTAPGDGELAWRRATELFRGLECRRLQGSLALKGERLALEVTTLLDRDTRTQPPAATTAAVEPGWLERVPAAGVMGVMSMAFEPSAAFWSSAFALADRVERADPARAELAPLRGRVNLLADVAGVKLEVDLWPHLRGLTASIMRDAEQPGIPTGALLVLHVDAEASAERLATELLPRLGTLLTGKKRPEERPRAAAGPGDARKLGMVNGRGLTVWQRGRDVLVAWGDDVWTACRDVTGRPERSVAPLCGGWAREGKRAPQRVGAVWPARCWSPIRGPAATSPAWRTLAEDPPVVWWGWNEATTAFDSIHCSGLRQRVHRFLDRVPGSGQ
ncbi:MAG: hypothetical protein ACHRXM_24620 [Isosphaerales bacterium]